jgi:hypothetical protein
MTYYAALDDCEIDEHTDDQVMLMFKPLVMQLIVEKVKLAPIHWIACFLDPSARRFLMLPEDQRAGKRQETVEAMAKFLSLYPSASAKATLDPEPAVTSPEDEEPVAKKQKGVFERFRSTCSSAQASLVLSLDEEIQAYLAMPAGDQPVLEFWRQNKKGLPKLAWIAQRVYVIPATSASSERCFSRAGRVMTKGRANLGDKAVDDIARGNSILRIEENAT